MKAELFRLPKQSIIVSGEIRVFARMAKEEKKTDINRIVGLLKEYRNKYSSVRLQHKAKDWWSNVYN